METGIWDIFSWLWALWGICISAFMKQLERWMSKISQENRAAYVQGFLMFFFCTRYLLEMGSEVNLKRARGVSLCSWESSLNLKQNFFLAEDGGGNKKCIRQTSCSAIILCFINLRENQLLSLEMLFSGAVTWQFSRGKKTACCILIFFVYKLVLNRAQADKTYCSVGFVQHSEMSQHSN